jgi:phage shock protein E
MKHRVHRLSLIMLLFATLVVGCSAPLEAGDGQHAPTAEVVQVELGPNVSPKALEQIYATGAVTVIDVREAWEYAEGHIPGATLIPLGELAQRIDEIPVGQPVVLVCRSDNRSGQAYRWLRQQGRENVHNMTGGMLAWQAAGYEMEK